MIRYSQRNHANPDGGAAAKPLIEPFKSLAGQRIIGTGGNLNPLDERGIAAIHAAALELLASTGISEAPSSAVKLVADAGGRLDDAGRLLFPEKLVEAALTGLQRDFTLYGRAADKDLVLTPGAVHVGTGGASPQLFDMQLGRYRDSCLADLYDAARLVDRLTHIHFFSRPLVARDMPDQQRLDVNTAYASLAGTTKHVFVSSGNAQSVADIARLCYRLAGSEAAFGNGPFSRCWSITLSRRCALIPSQLKFCRPQCAMASPCRSTLLASLARPAR